MSGEGMRLAVAGWRCRVNLKIANVTILVEPLVLQQNFFLCVSFFSNSLVMVGKYASGAMNKSFVSGGPAGLLAA